jgi:4-hydroxybenzoate polyprenyltransferase
MLRAARPHYWLKNLLLLFPAIAANAVTFHALSTLCLGIVAFSCAASASYVLNDLADLRSDRDNPLKRRRSIAAGHLEMQAIVGLLAILIGGGITISAFLPVGFQFTLAAYFALCVTYSLWLKRILILDMLLLVIFYDLRLVAGAEAISLPHSPWLLAAGSCIFATLALTKRVAQAARLPAEGSSKLPRLAYTAAHLSRMTNAAYVGIAASATISLGFLHSFGGGFSDLALFLAIVTTLCAWLARCLFLAANARLSEDMVLFILTDPFSLAILLLLGGLWLFGGEFGATAIFHADTRSGL